MDGLMRLGMGVIGLTALVLFTGCTSQDKLVQENTRLVTQNRELQTTLNDERAAKEALQNERNNLVSELSRLQSQPGGAGPSTGFGGIAGVETDVQGGNIHVRIPGDILFASGKVTLKESAEKTLDQIAGVINRDYAGKAIRIEGYTDTDPIHKSNWTDNLELSLQRAAAVHRYLQGKGVDANRMYAAGFGESKPRSTKAQSRRVEIVVVTRD